MVTAVDRFILDHARPVKFTAFPGRHCLKTALKSRFRSRAIAHILVLYFAYVYRAWATQRD
jgi:hypothetical protein